MLKTSKIYVAGHNGLVGSAVLRRLTADGYTNVVFKSSKELDLTNQRDVETFFEQNDIEYVFLCAAKVGGILANMKYRADFIHVNLMIQCNVIHCAFKFKVKKLLFLGSNCIYPKICEMPIKEEYLLSGHLESSNMSYAVAKIAGIEMCKAYNEQHGCKFISLMPINLYGPNDNYHPENSHVIASLIRKFIEGQKYNKPVIEVWGDGSAQREFLHSDDLASACIHFMNTYDGSEHVNIATGEEYSIRELTNILKEIVGYQGEIAFTSIQPNGTPRKILDTSKATLLGWKPSIKLADGLKQICENMKNEF
jgi:GDP-L-fucose synthase